MVNTHEKFPVDERHNTFYAADGSDLRDATVEETEKYGLAAAHKRRRPEAEPTTGIDTEKPREQSPRRRSKETESRYRGVERKNGRLSSRDSRKGRDKGRKSRSTGGTDRRESDKERDDHDLKRGETGGGDTGGVDEDE